jgi:hypothetical protein
VAETNGLLNRRGVQTPPRVRISPSPPVACFKKPDIALGSARKTILAQVRERARKVRSQAEAGSRPDQYPLFTRIKGAKARWV